jgi:hypothetical protein
LSSSKPLPQAAEERRAAQAAPSTAVRTVLFFMSIPDLR